jgi:alanine-glyoxylate transaminase / serine-glyoxylate transaminase / serine-pyruvate transaminase
MSFRRSSRLRRARLRAVFKTTSDAVFPTSGTGTSGMGLVLQNLVEHGDRVVVGVHGFFGGRLREQAERLGARVDVVEAPFGETTSFEALAAAVRRDKTAILAVVHAETSTGALLDLSGLGALCRESGALLVVDCVTSLGGTEFAFDALGVDAAFSCSQKCLGGPPGLSPVAFSDRALEKARRRKSKPPIFALDLFALLDYWIGPRTYHHTTPIATIYALHEALGLLLDEGLDAAFKRHKNAQAALLERLAPIGLRPFVDAPRRTPMLTTLRTPEGSDEGAIRAALYERYGVEIGGGLGPLKGRFLRVGHMGYGAREAYMAIVASALRDLLAT